MILWNIFKWAKSWPKKRIKKITTSLSDYTRSHCRYPVDALLSFLLLQPDSLVALQAVVRLVGGAFVGLQAAARLGAGAFVGLQAVARLVGGAFVGLQTVARLVGEAFVALRASLEAFFWTRNDKKYNFVLVDFISWTFGEYEKKLFMCRGGDA